MVMEFLFLQSSTLFSGSIGDFLNNPSISGVFSYVIPFLLIFALVFGILNRMGLFKENRAVTAIIALAVGLMALQMNIVPQFFSQIFPRFAVAISIILVILIVAGLFIDPKKPGLMYTLLVIAAIIVVIVLVQSAGSLGIPIGSWLQQNWDSTLVIVVIAGLFIGAIIAIMNSGRRRGEGRIEDYHPFLLGVPRE